MKYNASGGVSYHGVSQKMEVKGRNGGTESVDRGSFLLTY